MAAQGKDDDKSFLSRWSQRKRASEQERSAEDVQQGNAASADRAGNDAEPAATRPVAGDRPQADALPDIDSLDENSDFSAFLGSGVPSALQRRALRKLWQVDPAFKEICMLDDYNLDYSDAATVVPGLKTLYKVGRGMVMGDEEPAEGEAETAPGVADSSGTVTAADSGSQNESAKPAQTDAESEPTVDGTAPTEARRPSGPRVPAPAEGPGAGRQRQARSAPRSARERRWGDSEG